MIRSKDRLYELLPVVYRTRDVEQGYPLRALLRVITEQVDVVEDDINRLYANWFIETCDNWAIPYIGNLIGYTPLHETGEPSSATNQREIQRNKILIPRREVANTIFCRRRKGTIALLELLAKSVADWPARAVEFYRLLGWTQHLNHLRLLQGCTIDLHKGDMLDRLNGPFDELAHTIDLRRINAFHQQGWYNIPSVGVFIWRLKSYSVTRTPAYCLEGEADAKGPQCYTFSVLGNDTPLYNNPQPEEEATHIADELNLPTQIRRRSFEERIISGGRIQRTLASGSYYGIDRSVTIWAPEWPKKGAKQPLPKEAIIPADLKDWKYQAPRNFVLVDPERGRIVFPLGQLPKQGVAVSYRYAFSADLGGGEYNRSIIQPDVSALSKIHNVDIKAPALLASKLKNAPDKVSIYLKEHFSTVTRNLLEIYNSSEQPSVELQQAIITELNKALEDESLYEPQRFDQIVLPDEAKVLIGQNFQVHQPLRLNRLLIEATYPDEIAKSYAIYRVGEDEEFKQIKGALNKWLIDQPLNGIIEITDSNVYVEQIVISLNENQSLVLRAAIFARPVISLLNWHTDLPDSLSLTGSKGSSMMLDGLLITGRGVEVRGPEEDSSIKEDLCRLVIRHCTLVPGWGVHNDCRPKRSKEPSLELMNTSAQIRIDHSILGPILVTSNKIKNDPVRICLRDSILDATDPSLEALSASNGLIAHAVLNIERCTIFGKILTQAIDLAENCIFDGLIRVARSQRGCMRFCYVMPNSRTPRRYNCQPDLAEKAEIKELTEAAGSGKELQDADIEAAKTYARKSVRPQFNATYYGMPTYCQLSDDCPEEIKRGADDESEMGVFHDLYQPQREANLRSRLDEYAPSGMNVGIVFVS